MRRLETPGRTEPAKGPLPHAQAGLSGPSDVRFACTLASRLRGLHGYAWFDGTLVLIPCRDVHTFAMNRPIDVAFVSAEGIVLEVHRKVGPWRRLRNRSARATLERFATDEDWFKPGDFVQRMLGIANRAARHRGPSDSAYNPVDFG